MGKALGNLNIEQFSKNLYDFIINYKTIILITFFIGVAVNAVDVFTIKFGIDSEIYAITDSPQIYFDTQRYGSWLLYYLLPFARYHIISQLIGIFVLTMAALLTISRHNISNNAKLLFMVLFVTYPNFAFLQYYYFQSAYNFIGLLFVVVAYRLTEKNNIFLYFLASILLFIGITSYQANAAIFLCVVMINVILDYLHHKNYRTSFIQIFKSALFFIIILLIYYIIIKLNSDSLNKYHLSLLHKDNGLVDRIDFLIKYFYEAFTSSNFHTKHTANIVSSYVILAYFIYIIFHYKQIKSHLFFSLLVFGFMLAVISMNVMLDGPIRIDIAYAFFPAIILMLAFTLNKNIIIKLIVVLLSIYTIGFHTTKIVEFQTSYNITYMQDLAITYNLIDKLYNKYPEIYKGKYKIIFTGRIKAKNIHPFISPHFEFRKSFYNRRVSELSIRILSFMRLLGFPMDIKLGKLTDNMKQEIKNMPSYPNNDCVKLIGDTVIVKLSD